MLVVFIQFEVIQGLVGQIYDALLQKLSLGLVLALFGVLIVGVLVFAYLFLWTKTERGIVKKTKDIIIGLYEGVISIFKMKKKWAFIGHTIFIWAMYLLMFYLCFFSLPETQNVPFGGILTAFVLGGFTVVLTNGGIGAYPLAIQAVLLLYDIDKNTGGAFGWIVWSAQTVMLLFFGLISFILIPLYNKRYGNIEA